MIKVVKKKETKTVTKETKTTETSKEECHPKPLLVSIPNGIGAIFGPNKETGAFHQDIPVTENGRKGRVFINLPEGETKVKSGVYLAEGSGDHGVTLSFTPLTLVSSDEIPQVKTLVELAEMLDVHPFIPKPLSGIFICDNMSPDKNRPGAGHGTMMYDENHYIIVKGTEVFKKGSGVQVSGLDRPHGVVYLEPCSEPAPQLLTAQKLVETLGLQIVELKKEKTTTVEKAIEKAKKEKEEQESQQEKKQKTKKKK